MRVFLKGIDLLYGCFLKPSTEAFLLVIVPVGDLLDIIQGIRVNFDRVFFHQALSVFLASSQSISLSGFFLTLLNRSMTSFWCASGMSISFSLLSVPGFSVTFIKPRFLISSIKKPTLLSGISII